MPYTPPEKPSQIDLTEKIDNAGSECSWTRGAAALHPACAPRAQFRALVVTAQGAKLDVCAKAVGAVRLHFRMVNLVPCDRLEADTDLRERIIKRIDEGHHIAPFTYEESL